MPQEISKKAAEKFYYIIQNVSDRYDTQKICKSVLKKPNCTEMCPGLL